MQDIDTAQFRSQASKWSINWNSPRTLVVNWGSLCVNWSANWASSQKVQQRTEKNKGLGLFMEHRGSPVAFYEPWQHPRACQILNASCGAGGEGSGQLILRAEPRDATSHNRQRRVPDLSERSCDTAHRDFECCAKSGHPGA